MFRFLLLLSIGLLLHACAQPFSKRIVKNSQKLVGLDIPKRYHKHVANYLQRNRNGYDSMRVHPLDYTTSPAIRFDPDPQGFEIPTGKDQLNLEADLTVNLPENVEDIAFYTIPQLAGLLRQGKISSVKLTQLYLDRIARHDSILQAVISLTDELALQQARRADEEIAQGKYRSLLHGIPYGIKDLFAVPGYPTTWGAAPYQKQELDHKATVVQRLEDAGAILIAKLSSGALARGDVWFGGKTKNPWDTEKGASGSSAGSGSAVAAGLVGFAIGTETLGSITSPSNRNGITGLRPTYGRVSRYGCMSLSWSMDKVGPMCRSAEDCAIVFAAIEGADPKDAMAVEAPFDFGKEPDLAKMRIGILQKAIDKDTTDVGDNIRAAIEVLKSKGIEFIPVELPSSFPYNAFDIILRAEAGAFFEELVHSGKVDEMVQQDYGSRANSLRQARFIPAVEYLQANRHRQVLIDSMYMVMKDLDVLVTPTFARPQLLITNLTGHPVVTVPSGFNEDGMPTSISFLGNLYEEEKILALAREFQRSTDWTEKQPPAFQIK